MSLKKVFDVMKEEPEEEKPDKTEKPKAEKLKVEKIKVEKQEKSIDLPMVKKSLAVNLLHELALNEFKDRVNIKRQREKGKRMNDNEMWELILNRFFEIDEYKNCLKAAEAKMNDQ